MIIGLDNKTWLGSGIDQAAIDGRKAALPRLIVGVAAAGLLALNFGSIAGTIWLTFDLAVELLAWFVTQEFTQNLNVRPSLRARYLLVSLLIAAGWTTSTVLYWLSGEVGLRLFAVVICGAQLIHAQAFCLRSKAAMAMSAAPPAVTLIILPMFFGGFSGVVLLTVSVGVLLALAYIFAAARSNMAVDRALRVTQAELEKTALVDPLTTLANRRMFNRIVTEMITESSLTTTRFALILIDLDRFKAINDNFGHDAGDALLVHVAARLRSVVRQSDGLARLGGDEFAVVMSEAENPAHVQAFCERVIAALDDDIDFNGERLKVTPSLGIAVFPENGTCQASLYKGADVALYDAKRNGRNTWRACQPVLAA